MQKDRAINTFSSNDQKPMTCGKVRKKLSFNLLKGTLDYAHEAEGRLPDSKLLFGYLGLETVTVLMVVLAVVGGFVYWKLNSV